MLKRFFSQAYSSITDFDFYPSIVDQNLKKTLIFLLFFAALSAILATVITATQILPEVSHFFQWAETEFPPFRITEGILLVEADQPFVCTFNSDTPVTFIFDTTGTYTSPESFKEPAMLLASNQFFIRMQGQTQSYSWEDFSSIEINNSNLGEFGKALIFLFFPLAYSSYLLWGLFSIPLFALILTPISRFVGLTYGVRFPLQKSFTIALYSQVPATAIDLAVQATGLTITYFILIYFAIGAIYTYLATQKCSMIDPEAGQR
jgi:hypothetical protein